MLKSSKGKNCQLIYHFNHGSTVTVHREKMPTPEGWEKRDVVRNERTRLQEMHDNNEDLFLETESGMTVVPWIVLENVIVSMHDI